MTKKVDCICCGDLYPIIELDPDGICPACNAEDVDSFIYGFADDDFADEDDVPDEMNDWEGDDWEEDDDDEDDNDGW